MPKDTLELNPRLALHLGGTSSLASQQLADRGWDVVRVTSAFQAECVHPNVTELRDTLPGLPRLRLSGHRFQLIVLDEIEKVQSSVVRARLFRIVTELLSPGGQLVLRFFRGSAFGNGAGQASILEEVNRLAVDRALATVSEVSRCLEESLGTNVDGIIRKWMLPDDGTGSLPILRHIIVNDDKSATYKLGLLRALVRIAEGSPGLVLERDDHSVTLPMGLVGLVWLKLYLPLVLKYDLRQLKTADHSAHRGYGWAKEDFWHLAEISPFDLRVGASLSGEWAPVVFRAIHAACGNIEKMPATHITWPGSNRPVFEADSCSPGRAPNSWQLTRDSLRRFGTFRVPVAIWQTMGQYACWLDPAIVNEWVRLMQGYQVRYDEGTFRHALVWEEGRRFTGDVRQRAEGLLKEGFDLHCVWTDRSLVHKQFEIDHCFPWSRWGNNDLWNLLPVSLPANSRKGDKLPAAPLLHQRRSRIEEWWQEAYLNSEHRERFLIEADAALPLFDGDKFDLQSLFEAVLHQRARLKANQQLAEWPGQV